MSVAAFCGSWFDADEARKPHGPPSKIQFHRIASEDVGDFLFGGQHNERGLQQTGAHLRWRFRFRSLMTVRGALGCRSLRIRSRH